MYMFGLGEGWKNERTAKRKLKGTGITLVNHTDAQCKCGHGCEPHTCKKSRRHWFEAPNLGNPQNYEYSAMIAGL